MGPQETATFGMNHGVRRCTEGPTNMPRWGVERTFAWLGSFRRPLISYERYLCTFRAFFLIGLILVSLRRF